MFELSDDYYHMGIPESGMGDMIRGYLEIMFRWKRVPRPVKIYTFPSKIDLMNDIMDLFVERPRIEYVLMTREKIPEPWYTRLIHGTSGAVMRTHVIAVTDKQKHDYSSIKTKQHWTPGQHVAVYHTNFKVDYKPNTTLKNLPQVQWEMLEKKTLDTGNKMLGLPLTFKESVDILLNCRYAVGIEGGWTHVAQLFNIPYFIICNKPYRPRKINPEAHHRDAYKYFEQLHLVDFNQGLELIK